MNTLRRLAFSLLVGALLGTLGAVFVAPSVLEWFASPAIPNALSCVDAVSWALGRFRLIILSAAVGMGLGTLVLVEVLRPKRATPPSATPPGVSSPGTPPSRP